jgi:hypothetical protein
MQTVMITPFPYLKTENTPKIGEIPNHPDFRLAPSFALTHNRTLIKFHIAHPRSFFPDTPLHEPLAGHTHERSEQLRP